MALGSDSVQHITRGVSQYLPEKGIKLSLHGALADIAPVNRDVSSSAARLKLFYSAQVTFINHIFCDLFVNESAVCHAMQYLCRFPVG